MRITSVDGMRLGAMNFRRSVRLFFLSVSEVSVSGFKNSVFGAAALPEVR